MVRTRPDSHSQGDTHANSPLSHIEEDNQPTDTPNGTQSQQRRGRNIGRQMDGIEGKILIRANTEGEPNEPTECLLTRFISEIVSKGDTIPLHILDWRYVSATHIQRAMDKINTCFEFDNPLTLGWVRAKMNEHWKQTKFSLKSKFHNEALSLEEQYDTRPEHIMRNDWKVLVDYWRSLAGRKKSQVNQTDRAKLRVNQRVGTKTYARVRGEVAKSRGGVEPDDLELYLMTHTPKEGPKDPVTLELEDRLAHIPVNEQDTAMRGKVFTEIVGGSGHGRVPMRGLTVPSKLTRAHIESVTTAKLAAALAAQREAEEARRVSEAKMVQMQEQLDALWRAQEENKREQEARHAELIAGLAAFSTQPSFAYLMSQGMSNAQHQPHAQHHVLPQPQPQPQPQRQPQLQYDSDETEPPDSYEPRLII